MYKLYEGDCCVEIKKIPTASQHFSIFSPPFAELYVYSDLLADMGNSRNYEEFMTHFKFLIPELKRVMVPGRNVAIHCMDLPIQKGKEGYIGLRDFPSMLRQAFEEEGFIYHSKVTIWKDPVVEMTRTKALGLLHKQLKKDGAMSRVGLPDYLLVMRTPGENPIPITHQDTDPSKPNYIPVNLWQKYASPVWYDINYSNTLQFRTAKDEKDEKHICPLQLDTIERGIILWSNEGENVFSPFGGIGSEPYQALRMKRKATAIELKPSYFNLMQRNCERAIESKNQISVLDAV